MAKAKMTFEDNDLVMEAKLSKVSMVMDLVFCWVIIPLFMFFKHLIEYKTTKLVIYKTKVKGKTGWLHTSEMDSPLNKITSVKVEQKFWGKIFHYGTVIINGAGGDTYKFDLIANPDEFKNLLNKQIDAYDDIRIQKQAQAMASSMYNAVPVVNVNPNPNTVQPNSAQAEQNNNSSAQN